VIASGSGLRLGGWLFRHRGWLPIPLALAVLAFGNPTALSLGVGAGVALVGELLRLWAARAIGPASRTAGDRPGRLATGGPYALARNPIYVANIALYTSFSVSSGRWQVLLPYYALIVRWEERQLLGAHGADYAAYCARVPRWIPHTARSTPAPPLASWGGALRAERGSLVVLATALSLMGLRWAGS